VYIVVKALTRVSFDGIARPGPRPAGAAAAGPADEFVRSAEPFVFPAGGRFPLFAAIFFGCGITLLL
jgi:hypothetical protein